MISKGRTERSIPLFSARHKRFIKKLWPFPLALMAGLSFVMSSHWRDRRIKHIFPYSSPSVKSLLLMVSCPGIQSGERNGNEKEGSKEKGSKKICA
jgi:hypothetical protein